MENDVSSNAVQKGVAAGLKDWDTLSVSERTSGGGQFLSYVKALLCHTFFCCCPFFCIMFFVCPTYLIWRNLSIL